MNGIQRMAVLAVTASMALTACDDDGLSTPGTDDGDFAVVMQPAATSGSALLAPTDPSAARVPLSAVESILLPIGEVEAHGTEGIGWVAAGEVDETVDLMALPEDGITLLNSSLPQGGYTALRFMLTDEATITLSEDITVGRTVFEAGTYPLEIPSSQQNGVRLGADFEVDEDGQVLTVLFDGDATVRHVTATGSGVLKIAPELRVENEDGEDVGGIDDDDEADDDEDEDELEFEGLVSSVTDAGFVLEDGTAVLLTDETEIEGDLLSLTAVAEALLNEEAVEADVEGSLDDDGTTVIASKVEFEVDDDDGDGEVDDEDDGEAEVEGMVTAVDRSEMTFTLDADGQTLTVVVTEDTEVDGEDGLETFEDMADAFDGGTSLWAEAEGDWESENRLLATAVEFEGDDDDDEDDDDDDDAA